MIREANGGRAPWNGLNRCEDKEVDLLGRPVIDSLGAGWAVTREVETAPTPGVLTELAWWSCKVLGAVEAAHVVTVRDVGAAHVVTVRAATS